VVLHPIAEIEVYSIYNLRASNHSFLPQAEQVTKQIKMWLNPHKRLTEVNEGSHKKNQVWVQIANPDLVVKKQTLKKGMNRHPKAPLEEILKNYDLTNSGIRITFSLRRPPTAKLLVVQYPHLDEVVEGPGGAPGLLPFFCHHLGPLFGVALGHFLCKESRTESGGFGGNEEDEGRRLVCNCWVKF